MRKNELPLFIRYLTAAVGPFWILQVVGTRFTHFQL
jgi:hypothetical protein